MTRAPAGFQPLPAASPFNQLMGPLRAKRGEGSISLGLRVARKHCNSRGICHGGVLATLADLALGYALMARTGSRAGFVTAHLDIDYAGAAELGDWIQSEAEVQRVGSRLAFATGYLCAGGKRIVRMSGIFALPGRVAG
ncbi:MAG: PaaI family thioesterase [Betaproteobacteria bacterium]|nr:PaaI family thioesterase [Betaproteobacteria bacterium]MDH5221989.1 PaaI family thioesterase [Betaproteobacteria bacterium]MDH5349749.1 PaaI family thioesterase [Betaproteobacteria bacterium]